MWVVQVWGPAARIPHTDAFTPQPLRCNFPTVQACKSSVPITHASNRAVWILGAAVANRKVLCLIGFIYGSTQVAEAEGFD